VHATNRDKRPHPIAAGLVLLRVVDGEEVHASRLDPRQEQERAFRPNVFGLGLNLNAIAEFIADRRRKPARNA
jgi:hypothetical protein